MSEHYHDCHGLEMELSTVETCDGCTIRAHVVTDSIQSVKLPAERYQSCTPAREVLCCCSAAADTETSDLRYKTGANVMLTTAR